MDALTARGKILKPFGDKWVELGLTAKYADIPGAAPIEEVAWARVVIRHGDAGQASLSNNNGKKRWQTEGKVTFQIFAPSADAVKKAYHIAQEVVNAYRESKDSCVWFRNTQLKEVGASGGFYQVNVLTDFQYDDVR